MSPIPPVILALILTLKVFLILYRRYVTVALYLTVSRYNDPDIRHGLQTLKH